MLGLDDLTARFDSGSVREVILATNSTVEGEATAHYVGEMARARQLSVMRIAHGVPLGGELEYVDGGTLSPHTDLDYLFQFQCELGFSVGPAVKNVAENQSGPANRDYWLDSTGWATTILSLFSREACAPQVRNSFNEVRP